MQTQKFNIDKEYKSVYHYLKTNGFSERYITFLRRELGFVKKNGTPVTVREKLTTGDILEIVTDNNTKSSIMQCILPLDVVYEDEYYLIVNKPSGLTTIPTKSHYTENLAGAVSYYLSPKIENFTLRAINRLDKDTAGIVVFAKNLMSYNALKQIDKTYFAICKGQINEPITINKPIKTINIDGINQRKRVISDDGQEAITYVSPIKNYKDFTLVKLKLTHGRTHQIRVHLSNIGHALFGDEIYGEKCDKISHTALVCKEITFTHPFTKANLQLEVEFPEDFKNLINCL